VEIQLGDKNTICYHSLATAIHFEFLFFILEAQAEADGTHIIFAIVCRRRSELNDPYSQ
jgi:hypothetical protein